MQTFTLNESHLHISRIYVWLEVPVIFACLYAISKIFIGLKHFSKHHQPNCNGEKLLMPYLKIKLNVWDDWCVWCPACHMLHYNLSCILQNSVPPNHLDSLTKSIADVTDLSEKLWLSYSGQFHENFRFMSCTWTQLNGEQCSSDATCSHTDNKNNINNCPSFSKLRQHSQSHLDEASKSPGWYQALQCSDDGNYK